MGSRYVRQEGSRWRKKGLSTEFRAADGGHGGSEIGQNLTIYSAKDSGLQQFRPVSANVSELQKIKFKRKGRQ